MALVFYFRTCVFSFGVKHLVMENLNAVEIGSNLETYYADNPKAYFMFWIMFVPAGSMFILISLMLLRFYGAEWTMRLSTALGWARFVEVFSFTTARCYGVNVYVDSICMSHLTYLPSCMLRHNRLALVEVAGGLCANVMQIFALIRWLIESGLNIIDADGNNIIDADDRRTVVLYNLSRTLTLSACVREFIMYMPYFVVPAGHHSELWGEQPLVEVSVKLGACFTIVSLLIAVSLAESAYGSEKVLDWWLGFFQVPLRLFERIHLCGTK
jgi:hypothetical protein